jgi:solute carrier family 35 protein E3
MSAEPGQRGERTPSISSSSAETATNDDNAKLSRLDQDDDALEKLARPEDLEMGEEDEGLLPQLSEKPEPPTSTFYSSAIWMVVNTLATVGIVCVPLPVPFAGVALLSCIS